MLLDRILLQSLPGVVGVRVALSQKRYVPRQAGWAICVAIVAALLYTGAQRREENLYDVLELSRIGINTPWQLLSKEEIQAAHKVAAKKYHPDLNPSASANEIFTALTRAKNTLLSDAERSYYHRFGDSSDSVARDATGVKTIVLSATFLLYCFTIGYILTFPTSLHYARQVMVVHLVGSLCLELHMRFTEGDAILDWIPAVSRLLPFEKIQLLRQLFPGILAGGCAVSLALYRNEDEAFLHLMQSIMKANQVLTKRLAALLQTVPAATAAAGALGGVAQQKAVAEKAGQLHSAAELTARDKARGAISGSTDASGRKTPASTDAPQSSTEVLRSLVVDMSDDQREKFLKLLRDTPAPAASAGRKPGGIFNLQNLFIVGACVYYGLKIAKTQIN